MGGYIYINEVFTFSVAASNLIRNVGLHLGTPSELVNAALDNDIYFLHRLIGISPSDIRTTWKDTEFHIRKPSLHEDIAGNPIHLFLIMASILLYIFQRYREQDAGLYILSLLVAFLLFCIYLKWQPWHSRLHLALFVICAPFIGLMISRIRNHRIANLSMALLIIMALPWVFGNSSRPILRKNNIFTTNRIEQYFRNLPSLAGPYIESAQILSDLHCSNIGIIIVGEGFEYPIFVLLREKTNEIVRIEHVNVTNISQRKYNKNHLSTLNPCAIFAINADPLRSVSIGDVIYLRKYSYDSVSVYTRTSTP
jgi:hypothetical protein